MTGRLGAASRLRPTRRRLKDQLGQTGESATFPGYANVAEIGGGAFAAVYRATELETGRPVALKLLKLSAITSQVREAFVREVKALGALGAHPNIVSLYRTLTTPDGRPVLVLELCQGSMAERVRHYGPLPVAEAVSIGIKIAGALETAHRAGLLQRDMKPQNILITQYREPALADFGVAALQASAQSTEGVFGFTTLHAPPEVLEGRPLSPATDVYGLASTIYQLITGRAPFAAFEGEAPASVILRILRDPVPPLRLQDVPLELSDHLHQALAKSPEERPPSAVDFAETLRRVEWSCGWPLTSYAVYGEPIAFSHVGTESTGSAPSAAAGTAPDTVLGSPPVASSEGPSAGPGIVAPAAARRNVVAPTPSPPRTAPGQAREVPLAPTVGPSPVSSAPVERPIFVDPPAVPWQRPHSDPTTPPLSPPDGQPAPPPASWGGADGPYDQTLSYGGLTAALKANLESTPAFPIIEEPAMRRRRLAIGVTAGVATVVLLILIAILTGAV